MNAKEILERCGGSQNLTRVLRTSESVLLELASLEKHSFEHAETDTELNQVRLSGEQRPDEAVCHQLGRHIEAEQRRHLAEFLQPCDSIHRPGWHITPPQGLLNDPNGFIFHQGQYHLFYQWYPYACIHKDKYWAHLTSADLVNWHWQEVALTPSDWFDSHGVFSGHALSHNGQLQLFYTGNVRVGSDRQRLTTQCLAVSDDGLHFDKQGPVIAAPPAGVTEHIRDPKIIPFGDGYRMLLGAQRDDLTGRLAIYDSKDLKNWDYLGLMGDELGEHGYMWECPDMFELAGQSFVVIGPQGIESDSPYHTIPHHNGIVKAQWENAGEKLALSDFTSLDYGFDFYAPQSTLAADGRRLMIGWMGLPDEIDQPSADEGWVHQLGALRELSYENGRLIQKPAREYQTLRGDKRALSCGVDAGKRFELQVQMSPGSELRLHSDGEHYVSLRYDGDSQSLWFDRTHTLQRDGDRIRTLPLDGEPVVLTILSDVSSLEIFVNQGEHVLSGRVFTPENATAVSFSGQISCAALWPLHSSRAPFI